MQIIPVVKFAVSAVVGSGTAKIVAGVVKNNTNPEKVTDTVAIASATWVLGAVVAERTKQYTDKTIDEAVDFYNKSVKPKFQK